MKFRKYTQIEFNSLEEKIKGYLCGLWAADGSLKKSEKLVAIWQQEQDKATLDFIANTLVTPSAKIGICPPRNNSMVKSKQNQLYLNITHHSFYDYLMEMGITPAKTYTLNPKLEGKSDEFKWYFLRGVIDGDGCVLNSEQLKNRYILITSASKEFLKSLQTIFGGNIFQEKPRKNANPKFVIQYRLVFSGNKARFLSKFLPKDDFTMKRKSIKLEQLSIEKVQSDTKIIPPSIHNQLFGTIFNKSLYEPLLIDKIVRIFFYSSLTYKEICSCLFLRKSQLETILKRLELYKKPRNSVQETLFNAAKGTPK